jgi:hypothetical protein
MGQPLETDLAGTVFTRPGGYQGSQYRYGGQKPVPTGLYENRENRKNQSVFGTKINFRILGEKNRKPSGFFGLSTGFSDLLTDF